MLALVWHLWNRDLEDDVDIQLRSHVRSVISYTGISTIFLLIQSFVYPTNYEMVIKLVVMASAIGCMIFFNVARLHYFLVHPK